MKSSRRRSREFALQGLYQWQLAGTDPLTIVEQLSEGEDFKKIDVEYFNALLKGAVAGAAGDAAARAARGGRGARAVAGAARGLALFGAARPA